MCFISLQGVDCSSPNVYCPGDPNHYFYPGNTITQSHPLPRPLVPSLQMAPFIRISFKPFSPLPPSSHMIHSFFQSIQGLLHAVDQGNAVLGYVSAAVTGAGSCVIPSLARVAVPRQLRITPPPSLHSFIHSSFSFHFRLVPLSLSFIPLN